MIAIGLDVGTTTISALAVDAENGQVLKTSAAPNGAAQAECAPYENIQDAARILKTARETLDALLKHYKGRVAAVGLTGQMHGILYLDAEGNPLSPLYTWQDFRGGLPCEGNKNYAETLSSLTGYTPLATGYGSVTHFYNTRNRLVPPDAASLCTVGDFIGMKLTGKKRPVMHPSNAASLGVYHSASGDFDREKLSGAGMDASLFPRVTGGITLLGQTPGGIPVSAATGDNQASFLGSVQSMEDSILINVGTGGQISLHSGSARPSSPLIETRPLLGDGSHILVGSALCSGSAYALLESFFQKTLEMAGVPSQNLYEQMNALAEKALSLPGPEDPLEVSTLFRGTREDPSIRGAITGIGIHGFTPQGLILGFLNGISTEFLTLLACMELPPERVFTRLICSGNGIRKNKSLQAILTRRFGVPLYIPEHREEAAYGAALYALVAAGGFPDMERAQALIRYNRPA